MSRPSSFSWIDKPLLAAMARPEAPEELEWLRSQGIELVVSLTEDPVRRDWVDQANLLLFHAPMVDMEAPTQEQLARCLSAINRANERGMGVVVHCGAGLGRTGVVLAGYFVTKGQSATDAIAQVRRLRPGSVETDDQAETVEEFARQQRRGARNE